MMAPPQGSSPVPNGAAGLVHSHSHGGVHGGYGAYGGGPLKATAVLAGRPTFIQWDRLRFLIMDAPRDSNLVQYIKEAKQHNVTDIVRVCEESYSAKEVEAAGIRVHEMSYEDGASPPPDVIDRWLALVDEVFNKRSARPSSASNASTHSAGGGGIKDTAANAATAVSADPAASAASAGVPPSIAVHCVAGLGRAPVLVALALIEYGFGEPSAVVEFIRSQRRGAINMRQLNYLEQYQKRSSGSCGACAIM